MIPSIEKLKSIRAFAFDVDGVLTDGGLLACPDGDFLRTYDAKDGFALRMASMHGYGLAIITGGRSQSIVKRFLASGFTEEDIYLQSRDKTKQFAQFCNAHGFKPEEVLYIGDDMPDIPVIKACGLGVVPADAAEEAKEAADYISPYPGGHLCVRHAIEMVMKARGDWNLDVCEYEQKF